MMKFDGIAAFVAALEEGSISASARRLGLSAKLLALTESLKRSFAQKLEA